MGTDFQDESVIEINTLEDVIFSSLKNDISFKVNKKMVVLIEHQSTIDEKMPFRMLSYIARIYEKWITSDEYIDSGKKALRPQFIVLYNGEAPFPDQKFLKLSDSFEELDEDEKMIYGDLLSLDLLIVILNINKGRNPELKRKCKTLKGHAFFVGKEREYNKKYPRNVALRLAVEYCINKGILEDYLRKNASEKSQIRIIVGIVSFKVIKDKYLKRGLGLSTD